MTEWQLNTPVVWAIFNRPATTKIVFEAIRQVKPPKLLVIADGPRSDRPNEEEKCAAVRAIIEQVDWDCEVLKNYSPVNLGCRERVSSGLDWVFDTVEEAIILEDDCLPDRTFFRFCEELIDRYRDDDRVMSISGQNIQFGRNRTEYSYYFSRYYHCWGWATWKRAWHHYDVEMKLWPLVRDKGLLKDILQDSRAVEYWTKMFQATYAEQTKSWAYQWTFACWIQHGLTILPDRNLVGNIGFSSEATNTKHTESHYSNMYREAIAFPLKHPPFVIRNVAADRFTQNTAFDPSLITRARAKFNRILAKNKFRISI